MNITEAGAVNKALKFLNATKRGNDGVTTAVAEDAAVYLAERASKALAAGINAGDVLSAPAFKPGRTVRLSDEAYTVLCGLIAPNWLTSDESDAVNHGGIYSNAFDELRTAFPSAHFHEAVRDERYGEDFYDEEAGL